MQRHVKNVNFTKKDFVVDWFSGTGKGGQHRNKHQNCCRIHHPASGLRAQCTRHRERQSNLKEAFHRLVAKLLVHYSLTPADAQRNDGNIVVRTVHLERWTATDGVIEKSPDSVLDGDIDDFIKNGLLGVRPIIRTGRV